MANRTPTTITLLEAYHRAEAALTGGDPLRAIALTQHILRFYPHYLDAYRLLGEAYFERAHADEALRFFSHVLAADPQNVPARVGRAIIADERRQVDVAIAEYEQAFEIDPSITEVRGELLRLYQTRYGSAGATIRLTPSGLAYVHLRAGLREAAISELGYVAQLRPDRWDIEVALAEALWRNEQLDEAAAVAGDILAGHPACVKCCWMLGYLHWTAGRTESGRRYLMEAVALDPTYRIAQALWDATPWPLNRAVARVQPAPIPAPSPYDLVGADMDLTLSLPVFLDAADAVAAPPATVTGGEPSPLLLDTAGDTFGEPSPLLLDTAGDTFGEPSPLLPDGGEPAVEEGLLLEDGFVVLPGAEAAATPVPVEPAALDLDWFDDWASAAALPPPASEPVAAHATVPTDPAEIWAQFIAPGGVGPVWTQYPVPESSPAAVVLPASAPNAAPAVQAPLFAAAAAPMLTADPDRPELDLLLSSTAVPEAWQLPLELPAAVPPPPDPAQLALYLPEPALPSVADAGLAAAPAARPLPVVAPAGGWGGDPTPDLPTVRIENLSDDALLDWLLQAQLAPSGDGAQGALSGPAALPALDPAEIVAATTNPAAAVLPLDLPVGAAVISAATDRAEAVPPLDLPADATQAGEAGAIAPISPVAANDMADRPAGPPLDPAATDVTAFSGVAPVSLVAADDMADRPAGPPLDLVATDVTAFSEDDLLDWLIHQTPAVDPGANGSSAAAPPVAPPADLQALDSAAIATLTADDLLDWLTVAAPADAASADMTPIAGPHGTEFTHNKGEVSYNQRVLTGEVGYNHNAPDGVPDWLQQRPPGPPANG
ncbi:MAG: tetratricopeptide repeat protein [Chloroflexota bacterium]|nr:tetratricopeptide repeat protein [Chloroflexota bacterium]